MKYKEHIINYAIDNKVSLDEARKHFIIKGRDKKEKKFLDAYKDEPEPYVDPGLNEHFEDENYEAMDEPLYAEPGATLSPDEEAAWKIYDSMKDDLERIYNEYIDAPVTEDDLLWVEYQLRMIDKIIESDE